MDELIKPLLDEIGEYKKDREVVLSIHPLGFVFADGSMIRQVWVNLLSNAFKYTQKNEVTQIEIGARQELKETVFYVKDNGVGFSMDYAHKLFGVFQRLHKAEEFEGTGVGLEPRDMGRHPLPGQHRDVDPGRGRQPDRRRGPAQAEL